jgi:hypothetical protein
VQLGAWQGERAQPVSDFGMADGKPRGMPAGMMFSAQHAPRGRECSPPPLAAVLWPMGSRKAAEYFSQLMVCGSWLPWEPGFWATPANSTRPCGHMQGYAADTTRLTQRTTLCTRDTCTCARRVLAIATQLSDSLRNQHDSAGRIRGQYPLPHGAPHAPVRLCREWLQGQLAGAQHQATSLKVSPWSPALVQHKHGICQPLG